MEIRDEGGKRIDPAKFARSTDTPPSIQSAAITVQLSRLLLTRQDLRLASGLILFVYVAAHFTNHALGLISVAVAESGLRVAVAVWHSLPGTVLLYGAACIHITLAFVALYEHRTLRMPPMELLRIVLGFAIPTLLIAHADHDSGDL